MEVLGGTNLSGCCCCFEQPCLKNGVGSNYSSTDSQRCVPGVLEQSQDGRHVSDHICSSGNRANPTDATNLGNAWSTGSCASRLNLIIASSWNLKFSSIGTITPSELVVSNSWLCDRLCASRSTSPSAIADIFSVNYGVKMIMWLEQFYFIFNIE